MLCWPILLLGTFTDVTQGWKQNESGRPLRVLTSMGELVASPGEVSHAFISAAVSSWPIFLSSPILLGTGLSLGCLCF